MNLVKISFLAAIIGSINACIFLIFEFIVTQGTLYLWDTIFPTQHIRILVIPLAIIFSIVYSWIIKLYKEKRIIDIDTNIIKDTEQDVPTVKNIIKIFIIGAASLLAGASLGPEASLTKIAKNLGLLMSKKEKNPTLSNILMFSSIGALLVAFTGSLFPILIPILFFYKQEKKLHLITILLPIIAGLFSYSSLILLKGSATGFSTIPLAPNFRYIDILFAFLLGFIGTLLAVLLKQFMKKVESFPKHVELSHIWIISASLFGLVLGLGYFLGGSAIQFSGKEGTEVLIQYAQSFSITTLIIMIIMKILVTGWSITTGYRGGIVFPSLFFGVAVSLIFEKIHPIFTGSGIMIGTSTGIMVTLLSPILGFVMMVSLIPLELISVVIAGLVGSLIAVHFIKQFYSITSN